MAWEFQRLNWIDQRQILAAHMEMWRATDVNSAPAGDSFLLASAEYPGRWDFLSSDREHQVSSMHHLFLSLILLSSSARCRRSAGGPADLWIGCGAPSSVVGRILHRELLHLRAALRRIAGNLTHRRHRRVCCSPLPFDSVVFQ